MESVDAKMVRAKEHLDTLHAEAGMFFESTKRNFIPKTNGHEAWITPGKDSCWIVTPTASCCSRKGYRDAYSRPASILIRSERWR
jgi:hypothetical protein